MLSIDLLRLPAWLQQRRWFGGKGAEIASVRGVGATQISDTLVIAAVEVTYRGGRAKEHYLLPLKPGHAGLPEDGLDDDDARAVLRLIRERKRIETPNGRVTAERFDSGGGAARGDTAARSPLDTLGESPAVRRLSAEQSNTSVVFGDQVIVKLIRKLEDGVSPELEMGARLARAGFSATPQLLGAITLHGDIEATATVAHRFVKVESDGWSYVLDAFRREPRPSHKLLAELRDLGRRVGEMHVALSADPGDAAFAPEPLRRDDLQRWTDTLLRELDRTIDVARAALPGLAEKRPLLEQRIRKLASLEPARAGVKIRQHGDLHLGQVLRSDGRWLIFDFEGEPARTLVERRAKSSPYKDVAGMLRSFAYAQGSVELEGGAPGDRLGPAREAFLGGFCEAAGALVPPDADVQRVLLESFELEKLLYELRYEVGHRPAWVRIPARDLLGATTPEAP
jgi:maltokinase